ncbi:MAG: hypothetical protein IT434_01995 [Phycisphaerales bacterium]|nr:hypothetical protein [Phycisphaerales bacterium]
MYRCIAITPEGFIQQLAVSYVTHGYWFYVIGQVPHGKDPSVVDRKLIDRYGIDVSKWTRARRKRSGFANVHYLRHGRFFMLLATHGLHPLFEREAGVLKDCRRAPIRFAGYSISHRGGHAHVRIDKQIYLEFKAWMLERSSFLSVEQLCRAFRAAPFEPYAPVRRQLLTVWRAVNRARRAASLEPLPVQCIRLRRRIMQPFGESDERSVLLPSYDEVVMRSISAELDEVVAHPQAAHGAEDQVQVRTNESVPGIGIEQHAAREQAERSEENGEDELASAPTSNIASAARMPRLKRHES